MERFNLPFAGSVTELTPDYIESMAFQIGLFRDPIGQLKRYRDNLLKSGISEHDSDQMVGQIMPFIIDSLEKNIHNVDTATIPAEFQILLPGAVRDTLSVTRAIATIFRDIGVMQSSMKTWQMENFNSGTNTLEEHKLFSDRMRIIEEVYGTT